MNNRRQQTFDRSIREAVKTTAAARDRREAEQAPVRRRRYRLRLLCDRIIDRALWCQRSGGGYPPHLRARYQTLHRAWCRTFGPTNNLGGTQ
jgi:hypothetical protein